MDRKDITRKLLVLTVLLLTAVSTKLIPAQAAPSASYSYSYVSQNPSGQFRVDDTMTFELRLRNTGTETWYRDRASGCSVHLGTGEPGGVGDYRAQDHISPFYQAGLYGWLEGNDPNGVSYSGRRVLMVENSVAPNGTATFRFTIKVPAIIGPVYEYWTPVVEGPGCSNPHWMNSIGIHFQAHVFPFRYSFVSRDPAYDYWHSQPRTFEIVVRNEGPCTWYKNANTTYPSTDCRHYAIHLATGLYGITSDPNPYRIQDHASPFYTAGGTGWWTGTTGQNRVVMVENSVAPGQIAHFQFAASVAASATPIWEYFTPVAENLDWMTHKTGTDLRINNNPYRATLHSQNPVGTISMETGATRTVWVKFTNTGRNAWYQSSARLGTVHPTTNAEDFASPFYHSSWPGAARPASLSESSVAPGNVGTFAFTIQAPPTAGTYKLRVRPLVEHAWWMEEQSMDVYWNVQVTTPAPTPPAAPSNLSAAAVSGSQINLSWADNSNNEDGFKIERSPGGSSSWTQIATVGANVTSYQNTGLTCGTGYSYRVRAYNTGGDSGYSNVAAATTAACVTYRISGRIINGLNIGIENVTVSIGQYSTITDNEGRYMLTNIPAGIYSLSLVKTNFTFLGYPAILSVTNDMTINAVGHYTSLNVDSGFRPNPQGFSFANFSYIGESWDIFKRTFPNTVMENSDGSRKQGAEKYFYNTYWGIGAGGNCRGFSHASLIHYAGLGTLETVENDILLHPNNIIAYIYDMLPRVNGNVSPGQSDSKDYIHIYQGRQLSNEQIPVWGYPKDILQLVKDALADFKDNALDIAIFNGNSGHSVVPYRVEQTGNLARIYVYDNNFPGNTQKYIEIDTVNNTWRYNIWQITYWSGSGKYSMYVNLARQNFPASVDLSSLQGVSGSAVNFLEVNVRGNGIVPTFVDQNGNRLRIVGDTINEIPGARFKVIPMFNPEDPNVKNVVIYQLPFTSTYTLQVYSEHASTYTMTLIANGIATGLSALDLPGGTTDQIHINGTHEMSLQAIRDENEYCYFFADDKLTDASRLFRLCASPASTLGEHIYKVETDNRRLSFEYNGTRTNYVFNVVQTGHLAGTQTIIGQAASHRPIIISSSDGNGPGGLEWYSYSTDYSVYLPLVLRAK